MMNKYNLTALILLFILPFACTKEAVTPIDDRTDTISVEQAQQMARAQNFLTQMMSNVMLSSMTTPSLYDQTSTLTLPPFGCVEGSYLANDTDQFLMEFGDGPTAAQACTLPNGNVVGGHAIIDRNDTPSLLQTRQCQPGLLFFDQMHVQGCDVDVFYPQGTGGDPINNPLQFFVAEGCNPVTNPSGQTVPFYFRAPRFWQMELSDPNGGSTVIDPLDAPNTFMSITTDTNFPNWNSNPTALLNSLYNRCYNINIPIFGRKATQVYQYLPNNSIDFEHSFAVSTFKDLIFKPGTGCHYIQDGTLVMHTIGFPFAPTATIDFGAQDPTDPNDPNYVAGACNPWVEVCTPAPGAIYNASTGTWDEQICVVTKCLPFVGE